MSYWLLPTLSNRYRATLVPPSLHQRPYSRIYIFVFRGRNLHFSRYIWWQSDCWLVLKAYCWWVVDCLYNKFLLWRRQHLRKRLRWLLMIWLLPIYQVRPGIIYPGRSGISYGNKYHNVWSCNRGLCRKTVIQVWILYNSIQHDWQTCWFKQQ